MAEMAAAAGTMDFGAEHAVDAVLAGLDGLFVEGGVEAGPAGAALEFGVGAEQRAGAAGAMVDALALFGVQRAGAGAFGAVVAHDLVLLGGQALAPLGVR